MTLSQAAFVTGVPTISRTSSFFSPALSPARPQPQIRSRTAPARLATTAILGSKKNQVTAETIEAMDLSRTEKNRRIKELAVDTDPQGFTEYAERVNGRLAQMFFVIGLITEIASGKPMSEQILIMFSPLTNGIAFLVDAVQEIASTY